MFRAILVSIVAFLCIFLAGTPLFIYSLLRGSTDLLYRFAMISVRWVLWLGGVRAEVSGQENIRTGRATVYMPNHQSNCDPPAVIARLPPVLVLAKEEFFRVPLLGSMMRKLGFIPVNRHSRSQAIEALDFAARKLKEGHSFMVFPEGTRSPDGRVQPFKKGPFIMAIKAGAPIVPVSVSGSRKIMPKGEWVLHPGAMRIVFHSSIPTEGRNLQDLGALQAEVGAAILSGLAAEERPSG